MDAPVVFSSSLGFLKMIRLASAVVSINKHQESFVGTIDPLR